MSYTDIDPPRRAHGFGPKQGFGRRFDQSRWSHQDAAEDEGAERFSARGGWDGSTARGGSYDHRRSAEDRFDDTFRRTRNTVLRLLTQGRDWLDARGRGAWIAATILGFIFVWPVGLALLAYAIWSKRMFKSFCAPRSSRSQGYARGFSARSSGNMAFDAYREDTLRRLEEEQEAFESFLERLRAAKDKQEFDSFMEERVARARRAAAEDTADVTVSTEVDEANRARDA